MMLLVKSSQLKLNKILVGLALVMGMGVSHTALANTWITTSNNNCKAYNGNPQPNETATWSGECKDGYVHGQGTFQWYKNGKLTETYVGSYSEGRMHGKGVNTWADGSKYDGEYKDSKRHGLGKLTLVKGNNGIASWQKNNWGEWQGNIYVVQGGFYNGNLGQKMNNEQYANALKEQAEKARKEAEQKAEKARKEAEQKAKEEQDRLLAEQKEKELIASLKACGSRVYDAKAGITAEDFGNCDKVNTDEFIGLILYKQGGRYFDLHCRNGEKYDYDASAKRLINNFETDKCWKALHLIPNSCEVDNYRGQCDANKKPNGVGYQRYSYAKDWLTNYQIYKGMFKDGKRDGFGSYYELAGCGLLGCTSGWSRTGNAWFKNGDKVYGECTFSLKDCESKPIRQAEQARKEQEAYDRKVANFRKNLKVGDDATVGMVIEIKGNLIKIQTNDRQCSQKDYNGKCMNYVNTPVEKWVKRSELYPFN